MTLSIFDNGKSAANDQNSSVESYNSKMESLYSQDGRKCQMLLTVLREWLEGYHNMNMKLLL